MRVKNKVRGKNLKMGNSCVSKISKILAEVIFCTWLKTMCFFAARLVRAVTSTGTLGANEADEVAVVG